MQTLFQSEGIKYPLVRRGKVRDVYNIKDEYLIMIVSDRISAFDVVLPKGIPFKGQVLNQIEQKMEDHFKSSHIAASTVLMRLLIWLAGCASTPAAAPSEAAEQPAPQLVEERDLPGRSFLW